MSSVGSLFQGRTVARLTLAGLVLLLTAPLGGGPPLAEQAAAACKPSVAATFSNETKVGSEMRAATITITANAATGDGPDTLTRVTLTGARNGEVRVQGQPVTIPRSFELAQVSAWSFELRKSQPGLATMVF